MLGGLKLGLYRNTALFKLEYSELYSYFPICSAWFLLKRI